MKALCVVPFYDLAAEINRKVGDTFDVSAERFAEINAAGFGELVTKGEGDDEVSDADVEQAQQTDRPIRRRRKAGE